MIAGSNKVLIIDDESDICDLIADILKDKGFICAIAKNSDDAMDSIDKEPPSLIFLDIWLQNSNLDGLGVLEAVRQKYPNIPVIMISGHGTIEIAVNAIKMGAYDYIEKPFNSDRVLFAASRAQESLTLRKENAELKRKMMKRSDIVGTGETALNLKAIVDDISTGASRILLEGEFGTGKELIARAIHRKSNQNAPFIKINTCPINSDIAHREAISAASNSLNLLSTLNKGTLFISEVGKLALPVQHKLLKFMKEQQSTKLGGVHKADIKIICSASEDLKKAVKDGLLLQDFYYRISATTITIPPLRERKEDIKSLCMYFLGHFKKNIGFWGDVAIAPDAMSLLEEYEWPGNIKQLKNILELLMISARIKSKSVIDASMLPSHILSYEPADTIELDQDVAHMSLKKARETFEKQYLRMQMVKFNNNISKAALFVGMERSALHRKLKLLDICLSVDEKKRELEMA